MLLERASQHTSRKNGDEFRGDVEKLYGRVHKLARAGRASCERAAQPWPVYHTDQGKLVPTLLPELLESVRCTKVKSISVGMA